MPLIEMLNAPLLLECQWLRKEIWSDSAMSPAPTARMPFTQSFAGLPQEPERVDSGALRSGAIRISPVLLDEVCLKCRLDLVGCLQRVVRWPGPARCR